MNTRVIKRALPAVLLLAALLLTQNAAATLTDVLPESSHYQGSVYFAEDNLRGRIDFAVYDTLAYPNEFIGTDGFQALGDDQFIYAYQIFNDYEGISEATVGSFELLNIDGLPIYNCSAQDDLQNGIEPTDISTGFWAFSDGALIAGEHSWFLVFSSPNDWVAGSYEIRPHDDIPVPPIPEPSTIALLACGSIALLGKKRIL